MTLSIHLTMILESLLCASHKQASRDTTTIATRKHRVLTVLPGPQKCGLPVDGAEFSELLEDDSSPGISSVFPVFLLVRCPVLHCVAFLGLESEYRSERILLFPPLWRPNSRSSGSPSGSLWDHQRSLFGDRPINVQTCCLFSH